MIDRTRDKAIWDINDKNLALVVTRQLASLPFRHAFVSNNTPDICLLSLQTKESAYVFPLYSYYESAQQSLIDNSFRSINFKWDNLGWLETLQPFTSSVSDNFIQGEEAIFYYIYAILYSNIYRERYREFLKIDFPRIPFTKDYELFKKLAELGEQLINLHLLKSPELDNPIAKFPSRGSNIVEKIQYRPMIGEREARDVSELRRTGFKFENIGGFVWINDKQFFSDVEEEVWNYHIGGYQVLYKWLKDSKGRTPLSSDDIKHYCKIVTAISKTIEIQKQIDKLYSEVENHLI